MNLSGADVQILQMFARHETAAKLEPAYPEGFDKPLVEGQFCMGFVYVSHDILSLLEA